MVREHCPKFNNYCSVWCLLAREDHSLRDTSCSSTQCNCTKGINFLKINKIFYFPFLLGEEIKENCPQLTSMHITTYCFYNSIVIQQICIKGIYSLFDSVKCDYITHSICFLFPGKKKHNKLQTGKPACFYHDCQLGQLFLICQQRHQVLYPLPSYCLFQAQSEPQGLLSSSFA